MNDDDADSRDRWGLAAWRRDLTVAAAFLTRLPLRLAETDGMPALARAAHCFPLVGFAVGLLGGIVYALALGLSLPALLAAALAAAATVVATGALHEDGLADTADGFGAGGDRERKLAIMRDSRIGTYGVIALVLALTMRIAAIAAFADGEEGIAALIACQAMSRAFMAAAMHYEPLARGDGLAASAGRPTQSTMAWALGLGALITVLLAGLDGIAALAAGAAVAWIVAAVARRQIGGITGDVLGAVQQATEIAMLLALVALD